MNLEGKRIVITGASSGIGRAAALTCALKGARVAAIARSREGLESLARKMRGESRTFVADVTDPVVMQGVMDRIGRAWGGIDILINNAAISLYGEADRVPIEECKRVMDVNFFGQVNAYRAALPWLEASGGRVLAVLSVLSEASTPLQSVYVASKHALFGFYKCVREELLHRKSKVRITTFFLPSIATPLFDHAKTYMGFRPKPLSPTYPPEKAVKALLSEARKRRPRFVRTVGGFGFVARFAFRYLPWLAHRFQAKFGFAAQDSGVPKGEDGGDNLFAPLPGTSAVEGTTRVSKIVPILEEIAKPLGVAALLAAGLLLILAAA